MTGAGEESRTLDLNLGKVALYQLSYSRFELHVATAAQGQGVGTRLMAALLEDADRRGLSRVELSVYADNERARRLYERAGFVVEGRSRRGSFRDGGYADDLLMARVRAP